MTCTLVLSRLLQHRQAESGSTARGPGTLPQRGHCELTSNRASSLASSYVASCPCRRVDLRSGVVAFLAGLARA